MCLTQALAGRQMQENERRYFIAFFVILTAYVGSDLLGQFTSGHQGELCFFTTQLCIFESSFSSFLMLLLFGLLFCSGREKDGRTHGCSTARWRCGSFTGSCRFNPSFQKRATSLKSREYSLLNNTKSLFATLIPYQCREV